MPPRSPPIPRAWAEFAADIADTRFNTGGIANDSRSSDQAESADHGVTAGGGVRFGTMATKLTLEARYEWGLVNISKIPFGGDFKNTGLLVLAGLESRSRVGERRGPGPARHHRAGCLLTRPPLVATYVRPAAANPTNHA